MVDAQSDLLEIAALVVFGKACKNEIIADHAFTLAVEKADQHGLSVEDAIYNLEYVRPKNIH